MERNVECDSKAGQALGTKFLPYFQGIKQYTNTCNIVEHYQIMDRQ